MKIEINDNNISLNDGAGGTACIIMKKPEVDDYSNVTARPLVLNYHLVEKTIWERSCHFMQELQNTCGESPYLACYSLLFEQLYPVLLSSSQVKNIICYGMDEGERVSAVFQDFMTFLQEGSSFILLPGKPFVFSTLLNKSCQAAVVSLDKCVDLKIICDAISKIRDGGRLLLYTKKADVPDGLSALTGRALKRSFGSCTVYSITIDADVSAFAYENNSESEIMPSVEVLLNTLESLSGLTSAMENDVECPLEIYSSAVELLWQIENQLLNLYDVLENPELPTLANLLKEALMDCYIGIANQFDVETYFDRMWRAARMFYEKMEAEFGQNFPIIKN